MKVDETDLPSNSKFGAFFAVIFGFVSIYAFLQSYDLLAYASIGMAALFFFVTLYRPNKLQMLNVLWMRFGIILGIIVSPLILGLIFFLLFTPIAILQRIIGRDELQIKIRHGVSNWQKRNDSGTKFSDQY